MLIFILHSNMNTYVCNPLDKQLQAIGVYIKTIDFIFDFDVLVRGPADWWIWRNRGKKKTLARCHFVKRLQTGA